MPKPRKSLVSLDATSYYHCVSRCVRHAFLCGLDTLTGRSFEHRRQWIESRLLELAGIFAIDIAAYAVMNNHYHVVLHINRNKSVKWSADEVIERWHRLFSGSLLSRRHIQGESLKTAERDALKEQVKEWRSRLLSISWFMRCVNEPIAREANREDNVTGRFWEGRFKSQALLDEKALIACMAYVDLNPIRSRMAETPELSDYTTIRKRIQIDATVKQQEAVEQQSDRLFPFAGKYQTTQHDCMPFRLSDYLELLDWTGRIMRQDKRGHIPSHIPPILQRLDFDTRHWLYLSGHFERPFRNLVGTAYRVRKACKETGQRWAQGIRQCEKLFPAS